MGTEGVEQSERRPVSPLQIIQHQQHRSGVADGIGDGLEQQEPGQVGLLGIRHPQRVAAAQATQQL